MWTLPEYIGHPGYQYTPDGAPSDLFKTKLDDTLLKANITPLEPQMEKNINIYKGVNAWGEYVKYLDSNDIAPHEGSSMLKVVINNITPMTESYNNEFGPSELEGTVNNVVGNNLRDVAFATGYNGNVTLDEMQKNGGFAGFLAGGWKKFSEGVGAAGKLFNEQFGQDLQSFTANPAQKIDIPQMWRGNSYNCSFEITVRLFCFSPKDNKYFGDYILAPLGALMMFAIPKSNEGKFYTWPFMMKFQIPGLMHIPMAYCSNMTVVKGGDNNDLSYLSRPGMVDIRMTINSVWGVRVNAKSKDESDRPTILQELNAMYGLKTLEAPEAKQQSGGSSNSSTSTSRNAEMSPSDEAAVSAFTGK